MTFPGMAFDARGLRTRTAGGTPVRPFELFFDLVYVFAVTQLAHGLLAHLTLAGAAQTLLLLMAVWWAWMYTSWTTNWFHPDHVPVRLMLTGVMLASLVMAAAIPEAFGERSLSFAVAYSAIQVGRSVFVVVATRAQPLGPTFQRVLVWHCLTAVLWITGGLSTGLVTVVLWVLALALDYAAPWHGYATPGLGRSATAEWTIDAEHMAERCSLFVIIALGETLLITGATFASTDRSVGQLAAFVIAFGITVALWWLYFDRGTETAAARVAASDDPGRLGRSAYTYPHIPIVAGIIVTAAAVELVIAHPGGHLDLATGLAVLGGPILFLAGHAAFTRIVFGRFRLSTVVGIGTLGVVSGFSPLLPPVALAAVVLAVLTALATWDRVHSRSDGDDDLAT